MFVKYYSNCNSKLPNQFFNVIILNAYIAVSAASPCTVKTDSLESGKSLPDKKLPIINPLVRLPSWPSKKKFIYFIVREC